MTSHGVLNPNMEAKSQLLSLKKPLGVWFICLNVRSWLYYAKNKINLGLVFRVWSSFLIDLILNTSAKPHLLKVMPCRNPRRTWDLRLGTPFEVVGPNIHAFIHLNWLGTHVNRPLEVPISDTVSVTFPYLNKTNYPMTYWLCPRAELLVCFLFLLVQKFVHEWMYVDECRS